MDEADRLLEQGCADFTADLEVILEAVPARRQTLLFSATLTDTLNELKSLAMNRPFFWEAASEYVCLCSATRGILLFLCYLLTVSYIPCTPPSLATAVDFSALLSLPYRVRTVDELDQRYLLVPEAVKDAYLVHLIQTFQDEHEDWSIIIFTKTCK